MPRVSLFVLTAAFLVLISSSLTSQDPKPPGAPPGDATGSHPQAVPPAQESADANRRIHDSISDLLSSDPVVDGADIEVAVDDKNITLTGTVESYAQHQRVLQLVAQYGRWRRIVDHIK